MKVALYHPWIYLKSGLERTLLEIASRSRHDWVFYTSHYDSEGTFPELRECDIREINKVSVKRDYGAVISAAKNIFNIKLDASEFDALVVSCDGLGSFLNVRNNSKPLINLCFTPLRAVYDDEYRLRHLDHHSDKRLRALLMESGYKFVDKFLWRYYDSVICISETVRDRVIANNLADETKVRILYPGVDERRINASDIREPFFFLPGRIMWTKNIELGVKAFLQFNHLFENKFRLVVAGMVDQKSKEYFEHLQSLVGNSTRVEFVLGPTDEQMQMYYKTCYATLFTAFNEDLGLTPMEAMTHAKPVIAVNKGGPREVVDHLNTGLLLPPDENSFVAGMLALASNPEMAKAMGLRGMKRVENYTWKTFVDGLDAEVERLVGSRSQSVAAQT